MKCLEEDDIDLDNTKIGSYSPLLEVFSAYRNENKEVLTFDEIQEKMIKLGMKYTKDKILSFINLMKADSLLMVNDGKYEAKFCNDCLVVARKKALA
jgi:hypothetical protein